MAVTLSGRLYDPFGNALEDAGIRFRSARTSSQVLANYIAEATTDSNGDYTISVQFGSFHIEARQSTSDPWYTIARNIPITAETTSTDINSLIVAYLGGPDATPEIVLEIEAIVSVATAAAAAAQESKENAELYASQAADSAAYVASISSPYDGRSIHLDFSNSVFGVSKNAGAGINLGKSLGDLVEYSRSSTATYWAEDGTMKTAALDEPRIQYDPLTGYSDGLVVEGPSTNYIAQSGILSSSPWSQVGASAAASTEASPIGENWTAITEDAGTSQHKTRMIGVTHGITGETVLSVYVRPMPASSARDVVLRVEGVSGLVYQYIFSFTSGSVATTTGATSGYQDIGGGAYRIWVSTPADNDGNISQLSIGLSSIEGGVTYAGDGASGILATGAQLEEGVAPSSLIKTSGAAAAREPDAAYLNIASWFNASEYTICMSFFIDRTFSNSFLMSVGGATSRGVSVYASSGAALVATGDDTSASSPLGIPDRSAVSFCLAVSDLATTIYAGGESGSGGVTDVSEDTRLWIGRSFSSAYGPFGTLYGSISQVIVYPRALTQAEAEGITS